MYFGKTKISETAPRNNRGIIEEITYKGPLVKSGMMLISRQLNIN